MKIPTPSATIRVGCLRALFVIRSVYKNAIFGRMRSWEDRRGFTRLESVSIFDSTSPVRVHIDSEESILISSRTVILQSKSFLTVDIGPFHLRGRGVSLECNPFYYDMANLLAVTVLS